MPKNNVTAEDITAGIRQLGISSGDRLFFHSSLSSFGYVEGGATSVCRALIDAVGPDGTVAVPTFTWGNNHRQDVVEFSVANDTCETGAIPEAFRKLPGVLRSDHVCHSVAAYGPMAKEVMGDGVLSFGRGSAMYALYELDFKYFFLGCGFRPCTALHVAEEFARVPYRYYRHYEGSVVIQPDGKRAPSRSREFLPYIPFRNDFGKMEPILEDRGKLQKGSIGNAEIIATTARDIVDTALEYLGDDKGFLLTAAAQEYLKRWDGP